MRESCLQVLSGSSCYSSSSLGLQILDLPTPIITGANLLKQISIYTHHTGSVSLENPDEHHHISKKISGNRYICMSRSGSPGLAWCPIIIRGPGYFRLAIPQSLVCHLMVHPGCLTSKYPVSFLPAKRGRETRGTPPEFRNTS